MWDEETCAICNETRPHPQLAPLAPHSNRARETRQGTQQDEIRANDIQYCDVLCASRIANGNLTSHAFCSARRFHSFALFSQFGSYSSQICPANFP